MSAERDGIFAGNDPFVLARTWMEEAAKTEPNDPNAMALATVDDSGMPNVRVVLLKEIEADAVVFYTNFESAKGRELTASGKAALNLHWKTIRRQVRMRGTVEKVDDAQADAYYRSRPLGSRIGAWASEQSRPLSSREELSDRVARLTEELGDDPDRPPFWGGFRIRPYEIEFWADGPFRLHDRFRWTREELGNDWKCLRLNP